MKKIINRVKEEWGKMTPGFKISLIVVIVIILGGILGNAIDLWN